MSSLHLSTGSTIPAKADGKLRLYSMEYCPYAHRARLILNIKNVPHDIVNVNLINKPEWLFDIHPEGKVPALDSGTQIVVESLDICDYINDKYPTPPLYPAEPTEKQAQKEIIKKISNLTSVFTRIILEAEQKSLEEWFKELEPHLEFFENTLEKACAPAGGNYFGGEVPNMVDYMLWPWAERAGVIPMILGEKLPLGENDFSRLRTWRKTMRYRPEIVNIYTGPEKFRQIILFKTKGATPDYDSLK